jgi:hypothetical protein
MAFADDCNAEDRNSRILLWRSRCPVVLAIQLVQNIKETASRTGSLVLIGKSEHVPPCKADSGNDCISW